jgi:hypothetical protein
MISFTDEQLNQIFVAAGPLPAAERGAFLESVAFYFRDRVTVGDGELFRALRELQHEFMEPPRRMRPPRPEVHFKRRRNCDARAGTH